MPKACTNTQFKLLKYLLLVLPLYVVTAVEESHQEILVNNHWLIKQLNNETVVIVDSRTADEYAKGHILNAVNIPVASTYSTSKNNFKTGDLQQIQNLLSQVGIDYGQTLVIYGDGSYLDASRVFYVFEAFGLKDVKILDGGFPGWKRTPTNPISITPRALQVSAYIPRMEPLHTISKLDMLLAINDDDKVIIDARSTKDFLGTSNATDRTGHIPTAINVPSTENYRINGGVTQFKSLTELLEIYSNISKNKTIYLYCNKGKESARTYVVLRKLGFHVAQYDGSWYEWKNDINLPIVNPNE